MTPPRAASRTDLTFEGEVLLNEHTSGSVHMVKHVVAVEAAAVAIERARLRAAAGQIGLIEGKPHRIKRGQAGYPGWEIDLLLPLHELNRLLADPAGEPPATTYADAVRALDPAYYSGDDPAFGARAAGESRATAAPSEPDRDYEAFRAALHIAVGGCRDGRVESCYDTYHQPPIVPADWWPPLSPPVPGRAE